MSVTSGKKTTTGVELVYGSEVPGPRSLTIQELRRPEDRSEWKDIPSGFVRVQQNQESSGSGRSHTSWQGDLVVRGIYVSIETGVSRAALLEAARALRPA
jgi:hypothetical protein